MSDETVKDFEKQFNFGLMTIEQATDINEEKKQECKIIWYEQYVPNLFTILRDMENDQECSGKQSKKKLEKLQKELSVKDACIEKLQGEIKCMRVTLDTEKKQQQALNDNLGKQQRELQEVRERKSKMKSKLLHLQRSMQKLRLKTFSEQSTQTDFKLEPADMQLREEFHKLLNKFQHVAQSLETCYTEENECQTFNKSPKSKKKLLDDADFPDAGPESTKKYGKTEKSKQRFHKEVLRGSGVLEVTPETSDHKKDKTNTLRVHITTEKVVKHYSCTKRSTDKSHRDDDSKPGRRDIKTTTKQTSGRRPQSVKSNACDELHF